MYQDFAKIYDDMMGEIPYEHWFTLVKDYLHQKGISGKMCELGCGTGTLTEMFAKAGFEITGVDISEEMLMIAKDKNPEIMYVLQDMTELELGEEMDVFISLCDSMNYLLETEEMIAAMTGVEAFLKEDGIFLFDLKTKYCYTHIMGDRTMVEDEEEYVSIWENTFFEDEQINQYSLTLFEKDEQSGLYHRSEEVHHQRAYSLAEIESCLEAAGLELVEWFGKDMQKVDEEQTERIYIVAKKKGGAGV